MARILLVACLLCSTSQASATSVIYRSMRELVADSQVVVQGKVTEFESFWQGTRILSRSRVQLEDVWLGRAPNKPYVDVITLGGVVAGIGQRVDGAAALPLHQRVVVQLRSRGSEEYVPVAMAQGVWMIGAGDGLGAHITRPSADRVVMREGQVADAVPNTLGELKRAMLEAARAH